MTGANDRTAASLGKRGIPTGMRAELPSAATPHPTPSAPPHDGRRESRRWRLRSRETLLVAAVLLVALVLRLALAARGAPELNSDEATLGLMGDNILWHQAHPVFFYGQHYMGALQAYLAAPLFALLGATNFALHTLTSLQTVLFLLVLYAFARSVYSPAVAGISVVLLALGPAHALHDEVHAGVGAQDTLLFGTLLLYLVYLRLRRPQRAAVTYALALAIGVTLGLALWSDFLVLPYAVAALLALAVEAWRSLRRPSAHINVGAAQWNNAGRMPTLTRQGAVFLAGWVAGMLPLILANIGSGGATFTQVVFVAGGGGAAHPSSPLGRLGGLAQQAAATLIVGLPRMLGSTQVCPTCPAWPGQTPTVTSGDALRILLISLPFSLVVIVCWLVEASPLLRTLQRLWAARHAAAIPVASTPGTALAATGEPPVPTTASASPIWPSDAAWWGRVMLIMGVALTVAQYVATRESYLHSSSSTRYLIGIYIATPVVIAPLWRAAQPAVSRVSGWVTRRRATPRIPHPLVPGRGWGRGLFAPACLMVILAINLAGIPTAIAETNNPQRFGVPSGTRDTALLALLGAHHITAFYGGYWTCGRLEFEAREQLTCAVIRDDDAFTAGPERMPDDQARVRAATHPAYVLDLTVWKVSPRLPGEIETAIAQHDPRVAGYVSVALDGFVVFYFPG